MGKTIRLPGNFYTVTGEKNHTVHIQNKSSGLMKGRSETTGTGDGTKNIRMKRFFDLNQNKRRDSKDLYPGQIVGRTARGESKPTSLEVIPVRKHVRDHTEVRHHFRKLHKR